MKVMLVLALLAADAGTTSIDFSEDDERAPVEVMTGDPPPAAFDGGLRDKYQPQGQTGPGETAPRRKGCGGCDAGTLALAGAVIAVRRRS